MKEPIITAQPMATAIREAAINTIGREITIRVCRVMDGRRKISGRMEAMGRIRREVGAEVRNTL